jgi:hypothetical protein
MALPFHPFGNPPSGVAAELVFGSEPGAAGSEIRGAFFFDESDPFFESAASFAFEFGDPFLDHGDAGVDVVERGGLRHGACGENSLAQEEVKRKTRCRGHGVRNCRMVLAVVMMTHSTTIFPTAFITTIEIVKTYSKRAPFHIGVQSGSR